MLLVVNIGNTNIRFGVYEGESCHNSWVVNTKPFKTKDELVLLFKSTYEQYGIDYQSITQIAIGSVVPQQTLSVKLALKNLHQVSPRVIDRKTPSEVIFQSNQIGTDLYANAVAAHYYYPNQTKIVIDFGTALTFLGIIPSGKIEGVVIGPGVITSLNALVGNTAQLPEIEFVKPKKVLGNDTESCMQSGMVYGYLSLIEGMIDRIENELSTQCLVIATGGMSHIYTPLTEKISLNDRLHTLNGIKKLYNLNFED